MTITPASRRRLISAAAATFFFLFVAQFHAQAAWRAAGDVVRVERRTDGVVLTLSSGARAEVTFHDLDVARVRLAPRGVFERDYSYAIWSRDRKMVAAVVREVRDRIEITTRVEGPKIVITRRPFLVSVYDAAGQLIVEDDRAWPTSLDADGAFETSKRRDHLEMYYGFGEKAFNSLSRHNQRMVMWNFDTYGYPPGLDPIYQSIPFFIALRQGKAYGVFFDNTHRTYFDMGQTDPARYTFGAPGGELNYYVFTGGKERTPKKVLEDYTLLTGRAPLPPLWSLGYQQSRWSYYPESRVREIARGFRERRIPADVLYLDIDYMDGFRVFTWDRKGFPDPPKLMRDLRADGFRTVVIIDPGIKVDENYAVYRKGREQGMFHQTADGREFRASVWPGLCAFPDFTDPKARAWFGSLFQKNLDEGVSGFWTDMNEPATFPPDGRPAQPDIYHDPQRTFPLTVKHFGDGRPGDHARYHNVYGMQMARATFDGLQNLRPEERPFVLTRAGYAGVQRYSAVWTGDNAPTWAHLQLTIPMLTNMGVSGLAFVGADVGGFAGDASAELYTRWLQAAALTPFFRSHVGKDLQDREPWSFGDEFTKINRRTIELRYQLLPYIYSLFYEHGRTGAPVMRPTWFNYPEAFRTYVTPANAEDEYLIGSDLLVAPVTRPGALKRAVYFPGKGEQWIDWWTGERYAGDSTKEVNAPLDRLPLFVRAGASIPMQPVVQHTGEMSRAPLGLVVATTTGGGTGQSSFYQDSGEGYATQRNGWRITEVTQGANTIRLKNLGYEGGRLLSFVEMIGITAKPKEVRADGREVKDVSFDRDTRRLRFELPAQGASEIAIVP
ncbi:MAG: TIM-barrel domain-containing protein [Pyrinomonadaceae bacterium]